MTRIFVLCPDDNRPWGGIKGNYRHVDFLTKNGFQASILHVQRGFRCTWFENNTRVQWVASADIRPHDYLVLPEIPLALPTALAQHPTKVVMNRNCYNTFSLVNLEGLEFRHAYSDSAVKATITVSEDSERFLRMAFPSLPVYRLHNSIDPQIFKYCTKKKRQICFMGRKNLRDAIQVLALLQARGSLRGVAVAHIHNLTEREVARIFRESVMFMSFGHPEGFGRPPVEAMSCGCMAVGYHGMGGREYFRRDFAFPVDFGNIAAFVSSIEDVIELWSCNSVTYDRMTSQAAEFVCRKYSPQVEEEDTVRIWKDILS